MRISGAITAMLTGAGLLALVGCVQEPVPAYKTRPAGAELRLNDRNLATLDAKFDPGVLVYANLDRNRFEEFPQRLLMCTRLKWLRLNGNRLSSLPDLATLKNLRRIYLKDNRFAEVPPALEKLPNLTDIDLSGNPIREIPGWLARKRGLKNLSFSRTGITRLPDDLSAWRELASLQLGDLKLSAAEMARIRKALPDVAVIF